LPLLLGTVRLVRNVWAGTRLTGNFQARTLGEVGFRSVIALDMSGKESFRDFEPMTTVALVIEIYPLWKLHPFSSSRSRSLRRYSPSNVARGCAIAHGCLELVTIAYSCPLLKVVWLENYPLLKKSWLLHCIHVIWKQSEMNGLWINWQFDICFTRQKRLLSCR
jgi:hypothetical protein